ncbi:MAG: hypothetical protein DRP86_05730 [Candidatus Neomarinimicrobiota bacterium]|nr:MAG: hypothetical protein DRP86_05730 [Candidatus Neomarinimicrobiota bacterium]
MDCYSFTNLLTDYLDNQLKLPLRREAEAHLRECPSCRQKVEEMSGLVDALHALPEVSASDSFEAVLMEKIRHHKDSLQHPRNLWTLFSNHSRTFSAAAALILVMAGTLVIWRGYNPRLESLPPLMKSSPVLSSMGSSGTPPLSQQAATPLKGDVASSVTLKDSSDKKHPENNDGLDPEDFRNRIQLVNDRR